METYSIFNIASELWGCVFSILIIILILQSPKPRKMRTMVFLQLAISIFVLNISDAMGFMFEGRPAFIYRYIVGTANFFVFVMGYIILKLFTKYVTVCLEENGPVSRVPLTISRWLAFVGMLLVVVSQFNHMYYILDADNVYVRQDMFWLSQAIGLAGMALNAVMLISYRKRLGVYTKALMWSYIALPVIAMVIQLFIYGPALLNMAITTAMIVIFVFVQLNYARQGRIMEEAMNQQSMELAESRAKLTETRVDLMRSQIQPHFIYNTLGSIEELCHTSPEKAAEVVRNFSKYLRGNFDELGLSSPIRLSREIEHVKHYTAIEHVRFPDMEVRYDLRSGEFFLPALSIQPLVENAIKYGLMGLERGGKVVISTYETADAYYVSVRDNGVGFDTKAPYSRRDRKHLGIENIRERVQIMCGGTLRVDSVPGFGTEAIITIPKEDI